VQNNKVSSLSRQLKLVVSKFVERKTREQMKPFLIGDEPYASMLLPAAGLILFGWGQTSPLSYDDVAHLESIRLPTFKTADGDRTDRLEEIASDIPDFPTKRWMQFKRTLETTSPLETTA
jgi:hypothetical protein